MDVMTSFSLNYKQKLKKAKVTTKFFWIRDSFSCLKIVKSAIEQVVSEF